MFFTLYFSCWQSLEVNKTDSSSLSELFILTLNLGLPTFFFSTDCLNICFLDGYAIFFNCMSDRKPLV